MNAAPAPIRLRQVCLATRDLYAVIDDLRAVLGIEVCHGKADLARYGIPYEPPPQHSAAFFAQHGLVNALLPLGHTLVEVVAPTRADSPLARYLDRRRGAAGYMFIAEVDNVAPYEARVKAAGIRIAGGTDYPQYRDLQLDPRDVGGTLLTFSMQREGRPFDGGWYPAGPHWRATPGEVAMVGAEIACRDPHAVAARWSGVIGRPVAMGLRIALDSSEVRFTGDADERGERLAIVDVAGLDTSAVRQKAQARNLPLTDDGVAICGVSFRPV